MTMPLTMLDAMKYRECGAPTPDGPCREPAGKYCPVARRHACPKHTCKDENLIFEAQREDRIFHGDDVRFVNNPFPPARLWTEGGLANESD